MLPYMDPDGCCADEPFPHEWDHWADSGCVAAHVERMLDGLPIPDSWWRWIEETDPHWVGRVLMRHAWERNGQGAWKWEF